MKYLLAFMIVAISAGWFSSVYGAEYRFSVSCKVRVVDLEGRGVDSAEVAATGKTFDGGESGTRRIDQAVTDSEGFATLDLEFDRRGGLLLRRERMVLRWAGIKSALMPVRWRS